MIEHKRLEKANLIYDKLQDGESKEVFESRLFLPYDGRLGFWKRIKGNKEWVMPGFTDQTYVVFGAGMMGQYITDVLLTCGRKVTAYVDNNSRLHGRNINGIDIISPEQYVSAYSEIKIIMCSRTYQDSMIKQLVELGGKEENMIREEYVCAFCGRQYFDVFSPQQAEIFVDAGAFDMGTTHDFIEWCNGDYERIYAFEPDKYNIQKCRKWMNEKKDDRILLFHKGTYYYDGYAGFSCTGTGGATVTDEADDMINVAAIDSILNGKKATYIKMDVEGSELETLRGAEQTIRKYKPRLAVCVYHKNFDFIELPLYILQLNPDYKFYMRHYASNYCETVLYAC